MDHRIQWLVPVYAVDTAEHVDVDLIGLGWWCTRPMLRRRDILARRGIRRSGKPLCHVPLGSCDPPLERNHRVHMLLHWCRRGGCLARRRGLLCPPRLRRGGDVTHRHGDDARGYQSSVHPTTAGGQPLLGRRRVVTADATGPLPAGTPTPSHGAVTTRHQVTRPASRPL